MKKNEKKRFLFFNPSKFVLDSRLMFNFIDANTDSRLSYLEFRSWMLIIDQTLAEHELFRIFNEMDRNRTKSIYFFSFHFYIYFILI